MAKTIHHLAKRKYTSSFLLFFALILGFSHPSALSKKGKMSFATYDVVLPFTVTTPPIAANILSNEKADVLVMGVDQHNQRIAQIYTWTSDSVGLQAAKTFTIPKDILGYDLGDQDSNGLQALYFHTKKEILQYQPESDREELSPLLPLESIHLLDGAPFFSRRDFARDINQDQQDDFVFSHFESLNVWLSDCCNAWTKQRLPIPPKVNMSHVSVTFSDARVFFVDVSNDDKTDIVHIRDQEMRIFPQQSGGLFATQAYSTNLGSINAKEWWEMETSDGQSLDQSNLAHRVIDKIEDVNGDGVPDLVVSYTRSKGVFKKTNDYEFYFGEYGNNGIAYKAEADTVISNGSTLTGLSLTDIDSDGKLEVLASSIDIGVSKIIGALISGSIAQDVLIYKMSDNFLFPSAPEGEYSTKLTFSLSSGTSGIPLIKTADMDGDGSEDLVLSAGKEKIKIWRALSEGEKMMEKKQQKAKTTVPQNAEAIEIEDVTGDSKADIVMYYGRQDDAKLSNVIKVLVAH